MKKCFIFLISLGLLGSRICGFAAPAQAVKEVNEVKAVKEVKELKEARDVKVLQELPEVANPLQIEIVGDELLVLDGVEVIVYSLTKHCFLRKFGKRGEGPGELIPSPETPPQMQVYRDNILVNSPFKRVCFSLAGKVQQENSYSFFVNQVVPFRDLQAVVKTVPTETGEFHSHVILLDSQLKEKKTLYISKGLISLQKGKIVMPPRLVLVQSSADGKRLFVLDQLKDFRIDVFDAKGNPLPALHLDYPGIKLTSDIQKKIMTWLKLQPAFKEAPQEVINMLYFPGYLPVIRNFLVKDKKIYVQTYKTRDELAEFFIFDLEGKLLKNLYLPGACSAPMTIGPGTTYTFHEGKYYYLQEDIETGQWMLYSSIVER